MKRLLPIVSVLLCMLASCNRYAKYEAMLYPIESISASRPDSALRLYEALAPQMEGAPVRVKMYYDMMITKNMVNSGAQFTSDSMIRAVADFYDSHGEDSHRMLSRCLLGCVNLRMGNTPEASSTSSRQPAVPTLPPPAATTTCWGRSTHCWRTHISRPCCRATCLRRRASAIVTP